MKRFSLLLLLVCMISMLAFAKTEPKGSARGVMSWQASQKSPSVGVAPNPVNVSLDNVTVDLDFHRVFTLNIIGVSLTGHDEGNGTLTASDNSSDGEPWWWSWWHGPICCPH